VWIILHRLKNFSPSQKIRLGGQVLLVLSMLGAFSTGLTTVLERLTAPVPVYAVSLTNDCPGDNPLPVDESTTVDEAEYWYNETYGWFDPHHFGAGNPAKLIDDVRAAVANGGGLVTVQQDVRGGITGHVAHYWVSRHVVPEQVIAVAFGIYQDWSYRFEAWQDQPPRVFAAPLTAFAVEDLPSHYIGFASVIKELTPLEVITCYLGPVQATNEAPPRLVTDNDQQDESLLAALADVQHLENRTFEPMVHRDEQWVNVPWPPALRMNSIPSASRLWHFEQENTWYFSEETLPPPNRSLVQR
jgi:hypothetical protein